MSDSPDPSKPQDDLPEKPKVPQVRPPQVFEGSVEITTGEPRTITKIVEQPSLSYHVGMAAREWFKSRVKSFWSNLRADAALSREAFKAAFSEGRWSKMIAVLRQAHNSVSWILGTGLLALILGVYVTYIYPVVGKRWTGLIALSLLVFGLLVTIRVTRKLYDKASTSFLEIQGQVANLTAASEDHARTIQAARTALATLRREKALLEEQVEPKVEITNVFWDQYEGIGEDGKPDSFQLLRLEVTSSVATWAQVTVDQVELDGYPLRKLHLHIQHKPWDINKTELLPGRPEYWDVVQKARRSDDIELMHVEPLVQARLLNKGNKFHLNLTVACDKGLAVSKTITIERNTDELRFTY